MRLKFIKKMIMIILLFTIAVLNNQFNYAEDNKIEDDNTNVLIEYKSHIQDIGWQGYVKDGETSGTTGKSKRLEAIQIKGINLPEGVELKYQAHVQDIGWQDEKKEGEIAGTINQFKRIEAI